MALEELTINPAPFVSVAEVIAASRLPPWLPIPGIRNGSEGATLRMCAIAPG